MAASKSLVNPSVFQTTCHKKKLLFRSTHIHSKPQCCTQKPNFFFASLRAAGGGMSTNFLPFNARSGLSISLKSPYAEGIQNARVSGLEKGQEMPFALT